MTEKKYILTQSQLEAIVFRAGSYAVGGSNYGADAVAIIDLLRSLKPVEPLTLEAENTRLRELLSQALGALKFAKSVIGHPDDAGNKSIYDAIIAIEKEGIK